MAAFSGWPNLRFHHRLYLHYFDRELGESVGFTPDEPLIRSVTSCLLIANPTELYCGLSPVWETASARGPVIRFVTDLALGGHLLLMSNHPTTNEFIAARQSAYSHDRDRYPMYYGDNYGALEDLPLTPKLQSATQFLRSGLSVWASEPPQAIFLAFPERAPRNKLLRAVTTALNRRDQEAVTFALFDGRLRLFRHDPEFDGHLRREISCRYTAHNCADGGEIPTGIKKLLYYDRISGMFPFYDLPLLNRILRDSGAIRLASQELWDSFLALRGEAGHQLFCDRLRLFVCGLCGEAGIALPATASHGGRSRLRQAATRHLLETRRDLPAETARDVLLASVDRINRAIERGRQARPFAEGTAAMDRGPEPAELSTGVSASPPRSRWVTDPVGPRLYVADGRWGGEETRRLRNELMRTYPSRDELAILVSDSLSTNLNEVASSDNLRTATHQLIEWANIDPPRRLSHLVQFAARERGSSELQALADILPPEA